MTVQWRAAATAPGIGNLLCCCTARERVSFPLAALEISACLLAAPLGWSAGRLVRLACLLACLLDMKRADGFFFVLGRGKKENPQPPQWHSEMTLAECELPVAPNCI